MLEILRLLKNTSTQLFWKLRLTDEKHLLVRPLNAILDKTKINAQANHDSLPIGW